MSDMRDDRLNEYYQAAESWSDDRNRRIERSRKIAWMIAGVLATIALFEALALVLLIPLRRDVPYTLMVDRQTGYVQALRPLEEDRIAADTALTRSFLAQYVVAREGFSAGSIQDNYRKVGLWSADRARQRYLAQMRSNNPSSPLASLPPGASIDVDLRSISALDSDTALVRFETIQTDRAGQPSLVQNWAAVINYRYVDAAMSTEDRLANPLGFQVTRYRRDPETLPRIEGEAPDLAPRVGEEP